MSNVEGNLLLICTRRYKSFSDLYLKKKIKKYPLSNAESFSSFLLGAVEASS